jgi:hypothetical protein
MKSKKQKVYKMKGCSSKSRKSRSGGSTNLADYNLAYPAKGITFLPNPALAYTGTSASTGASAMTGGSSNLACRGDTNVNGQSTRDVLAYTGTSSSSAYPSQGPPPASQNWLGSQMTRGGGSLVGGSCNCGMPILQGGSHRSSCKCSGCKSGQKGGNGLPYGQGLPEMRGAPYPNGLTGSPWKPPIANWPGVDGISGDRNHLSYNTYSPNDVSRQMVDVGANPPFSMMGGASRCASTGAMMGGVMLGTSGSRRKTSRRKGGRKGKKGGGFSNFITQDFLNLGRQVQNNLGTTYNALNGYAAPVSPLPWKDQLPNTYNRHPIF